MKWAVWIGYTPKGDKLYLSSQRYYISFSDGKVDAGPNEYSLNAWRDCGWTIEEANICLENK